MVAERIARSLMSASADVLMIEARPLGGCTVAQAVRVGSRTTVQVSDRVPGPQVAAVARHAVTEHRRTGYCHARACPDGARWLAPTLPAASGG